MAIPVLLSWLASQGLGLVRDAVMTKGQEFVEKKLGVKLPTQSEQMTPEKSAELTKLQFEHEEFLINAALKEKELEIDAEKAGQAQVTDRWRVDMSSDSWLSKNVRPMTLVYWTVAITLLIIMDSIGEWMEIDELWIDLIKYSYIAILTAYFVGRGAEKSVSMVTKMKEKISVSRR